MRINFINQSYRRFYKTHKKEIDSAIQRCLSHGELTLRKAVSDLENTLAHLIGTKYAVAVGSGTDALFLSLKALGIGPGDEVITCSHTFIASLQAIIHCGANPILVDVNEDELIDVSQIEKKITRRTKAIMPIHYTGKVCDMDAIMRIAKKHKLYVVEDACQALGASQKNKRAGSFGDVGCFSFNTAKMLGCYGDGGAITTNSKALYKKLMLLRNHWNMSQLSVRKEDFQQPKVLSWGWKSRLDNIQAAVLNVKLKYLSRIIKRRKEIADMYWDGIKTNKIWLPEHQPGQVWQEYHVLVEDRNNFVEYMKKKGIELLVRDTIPNHKQIGLGLEQWNLPVTESLANWIVRLPLYPELRNDEIRYIIKCINQYYAE